MIFKSENKNSNIFLFQKNSSKKGHLKNDLKLLKRISDERPFKNDSQWFTTKKDGQPWF